MRRVGELVRILTISASAALLAPAGALAQQAPAAAQAQTPRATAPIPAVQAPAEAKAPAEPEAPAQTAAPAEATAPAAEKAEAKVPVEPKAPAMTAAPADSKAPAEAKAETKAPAAAPKPAEVKAEAKAPAKPKAEAKAPPKKPSKAGAKQQAKAPPQERLPAMPPGAVGKGPLALTSSAAAIYQEYFADACPQVLTVTAFGWTAHAALGAPKDCPGGMPSVTQAQVRAAVSACSAAAYDPPCSVIAAGRKIFWDGPISVLRGRHTPQGDDQFSVVLRILPRDGDLNPGFATAAGLATYAADGQSADIRLMTHDELGQCRGSLRRHDDAAATVALACTRVGAINGSFDPAPDGRTGSGAATGAGERQFVLKVLPHTDFMNMGSGQAQPGPSVDAAQPKKRGQS